MTINYGAHLYHDGTFDQTLLAWVRADIRAEQQAGPAIRQERLAAYHKQKSAATSPKRDSHRTRAPKRKKTWLDGYTRARLNAERIQDAALRVQTLAEIEAARLADPLALPLDAYQPPRGTALDDGAVAGEKTPTTGWDLEANEEQMDEAVEALP